MSECKDCNCTTKYVNNLFNNKKNTIYTNILCKKNSSNIKFLLPFEIIFYLTSFASFSLYNYNYNYKKNKKFSYI